MVYVDVIDASWLDVVIGIKTALRSYTDFPKILQEGKYFFIVWIRILLSLITTKAKLIEVTKTNFRLLAKMGITINFIINPL